MNKFKEIWSNIPKKTKKIAAIGAISVLVVIGLMAALLKSNSNKNMGTPIALFTELKQEEAKEIVRILQDQNVPYEYDDKGTIRVPEDKVDGIRAELLSKGYPKSGFAYDMYLGNTGLMTTESDKKQYTLYELQDRLGATISLFEGVDDAKVTIASNDESKYVLNDDKKDAKASIVVTMRNGASLSPKNANAIKQLVAKSVKGMNFTDVSVFDSETMLEIGNSMEDEGATDITRKIENALSSKVTRILGQIYGTDNVVVAVKGNVNMSKLISESTKYQVPEKIDEKDKTGLLKNENSSAANAGKEGEENGGVAGTDSNADVPRYTEVDGQNGAGKGFSESHHEREWIYDTIKEQKEIKPGTLEDVSVAVAIETDNTTIPIRELQVLVADAVGINRDEAEQKISVLRHPLPDKEEVKAKKEKAKEPIWKKLPIPVLIGIGAGLLILIILIILFVKKKSKKEEEETQSPDELISEDKEEIDIEKEREEMRKQLAQDNELSSIEAERGEELTKNVSDFVDENPQAAAGLIQTWIKGGDDNGSKR